MDDTEYIRHVLSTTNDEFSTELFKDLKNASAILTKFMKRGEIEFIRWASNGSRPSKVYRVIKLKTFKMRGMNSAKPSTIIRKRKEIPLNPVVQNWKDAFPEMFAIPEFNIIGKTIHKGDME